MEMCDAPRRPERARGERGCGSLSFTRAASDTSRTHLPMPSCDRVRVRVRVRLRVRLLATCPPASDRRALLRLALSAGEEEDEPERSALRSGADAPTVVTRAPGGASLGGAQRAVVRMRSVRRACARRACTMAKACPARRLARSQFAALPRPLGPARPLAPAPSTCAWNPAELDVSHSAVWRPAATHDAGAPAAAPTSKARQQGRAWRASAGPALLADDRGGM